MKAGDRVCFSTYNVDETKVARTGVVIDTFYEPGDPIMGVNVKDDDGRPFGGLDSQDVMPVEHLEALQQAVEVHNALVSSYRP